MCTVLKESVSVFEPISSDMGLKVIDSGYPRVMGKAFYDMLLES